LRVVFSPDGELLASGGQDGNIRLSARTGGPSTLFEGHKGAVRNLVFSPDGELLASSGDDQIARVWDLSGHPIWSVETVTFRERAPLAFSTDGQLVAAPDAAGGIALLDVDSGMTRTLGREPSQVMALAFSPDGRQIAAGSINGKITLYDVASGESRSIGGHEQAVSALAFSSSGAWLASGSLDHTVGFWDVATGEGRRVSASGGGISEIAFLQGDQVVVTLSTVETKVRVWDRATFTERKPLGGHEDMVTSFSFCPDKRRLVTASLDGTMRLWSLESGESRVLTGHTDGISSIACSPDGEIFASASADATVRLWTDDLPEDGAALRAWIDAATPDTIDLYHQDPAPPAELLVR
jgi:WD40 repeat protein